MAETGASLAQATAKAWWRIVPLLGALYFVSFLDRVNVGFAALQMNADIGLSASAFGLGAGIFFVGYILFAVPANLILRRVGAARWLGAIGIIWGLVSACTAFVSTPLQFYVVRLLLGIVEAGFFPGVIFYLTSWFPDFVRGRIVSSFFAALPLSNVIGAPLSGWLLGFPMFGFAGWQIMFLVEAVPAALLGALAVAVLPDGPQAAPWLSTEERRLLLEATNTGGGARSVAAEGLREPIVWLWGVIYFFIVAGLYGFGFWAPQIIEALSGASEVEVGLLTAIPYLAAVILIYPWARHSDITGERKWHLVLPTLAGAAGFLFAGQAPSVPLAVAGFTVAVVGIYVACPVFWTLPGARLGGAAVASAIAMINSIGNLAGLVGPVAMGWLRDWTGGYVAGLQALAVSMFVAALIALATTRQKAPPKSVVVQQADIQERTES